jgi:prepilin-type N-terminal cleavage/methylation domain-containing protein
MKVSSKAGFTLVEIAVAATILLVVLLIVAQLQSSTSSLSSTATTRGMLQEASQRALDDVVEDLRWADDWAVIIWMHNGSSRIDLRVPVGEVNGVPVWSSWITFRVEPSDYDSNGDGIANDTRLVRMQDGEVRTLSLHMAAGGFDVQRDADGITVEVNLTRLDSGTKQMVEASASTTVIPRN